MTSGAQPVTKRGEGIGKQSALYTPTCLVDLFLVRRSGKRWNTARQSDKCVAVSLTILASLDKVGENST